MGYGLPCDRRRLIPAEPAATYVRPPYVAPVEAAQRTQVVPDELTLALSPFNFIVVVRVSYSLDP